MYEEGVSTNAWAQLQNHGIEDTIDKEICTHNPHAIAFPVIMCTTALAAYIYNIL
jgi:hypothetical protein